MYLLITEGRFSTAVRVKGRGWRQDSEYSGDVLGERMIAQFEVGDGEGGESPFPLSPGSCILREFANTEPWNLEHRDGSHQLHPRAQGRETEDLCRQVISFNLQRET